MSTRVLIVDDAPSIRQLVRLQLIELKAEACEAADGLAAWLLLESEAAARRPFRFIVSDWNMPGLTGIELLRRCRAHSAYQEVRFLFLTSELDPARLEEARRAGCDRYLTKPFDPVELKRELGAWIII